MMLYTVKRASFHPELASSPSEVSSKITRTWPWRSRQLLDVGWHFGGWGTNICGYMLALRRKKKKKMKKAVWNVQTENYQVACCNFFTIYYKQEKISVSILQYTKVIPLNLIFSGQNVKISKNNIAIIQWLELKPTKTLLGGLDQLVYSVFSSI